MTLRINIFGEKVQVFCNDKPLELGADAFILGLMTAWRIRNDQPAPLSSGEIARLTAKEEIGTKPADSHLDRVRHAKARIRNKLVAELGLAPKISLEDIVEGAETDAVLFRQGIEQGKKACKPADLLKLEKTLLLYDVLFKQYYTLDEDLNIEIGFKQREYEALFCIGLKRLMDEKSPCLHNVIAAKLRHIQEATFEDLDTIKLELLAGYKTAVAQSAAKIPLSTQDLAIERVFVDAEDRPTNLAARRDCFIGREEEAEEIQAHLDTEWLITLTGTGGCGKTTLMREVGRNILKSGMEEFPDGVWFVNLIPIRQDADKEALAKRILKTLGLRQVSEISAYEALLNYLQDKRMLLLLDNCEHVQRYVCPLIARIGDECSKVKMLVTTREAHGSKWGRQIKVLPFVSLDPECLPELDIALQNEAVRLFQHSRQKIHAGFQISEADLVPIAQICRLLSGIPLAIELVACKSGRLEALATSLKTHWEEISDEPEDAEERHETMNHCILWSYDRLRPKEQRLLRRLALFAGGWTLEMCQEVCATHDLEKEEVVELLSRLRASSMIVLDEQIDRYHFLEPVRGFTEQQLKSSEEKEEILKRFEAWLKPMIEMEDFRVIGSADDNKVHRALAEAANTEKFVEERAKNSEFSAFDVELHSIIYRYAEGAFRVVRKRLNIFDKIVEKYPCEKQMRYHLTMGAVCFAESNYAEVLVHSDKGLNAATSLGDRKHMALAHSAMGICKAFLKLPEAESQVRRGWELAQETQDEWAMAFSQMCLGAWKWQSNHLDQALAYYEAAFAGFQQHRDKIMSAMALNSLAHLVCRSGDASRATGYYLDSLALSVEGKFKNARGIAGCVLGACGVALTLEHYEQAALFWGAAETHYERLGAKLIPPVQADYDREIPLVQQKLGSRFTQLHRAGQRLSLTDAAKQARSFLESVCMSESRNLKTTLHAPEPQEAAG